MAYKTDIQLKTQVDAVIVVNGNREITPPLDNSIRTNFIDSKLNLAGGNVLLSLTGYTSNLTPSDNKHLTPKKYVDDSGLLLLPLDGSRSMTSDLQFTAGNKGLLWANTSSIKTNAFGGLDITSFSGDVSTYSGGGIYSQTAIGGGITYNADQDVTINSDNSSITLFAPTDHINLVSAHLSASTIVYLDSSQNLVSLANSAGVLTNNGSGTFSWTTPTVGTVTSVSGTTNRITSTGGATPVIDISASYVGQSSITTLGTIATGLWQGTLISPIYGGTGLGTVAAGSILGYNTLNTASAITSTSGLKSLQNSAGTISWASTTGTGSAVFDNTPTLITPVLGAATATTINSVTIARLSTAIKLGLTITDGASNVSNVGLGSTIQLGQNTTTLVGTNVNSNSSAVRTYGLGYNINSAKLGNSNLYMFGNDIVLYTAATNQILMGAFMTVSSTKNIILNPSNSSNVTYAGGNNVYIGCDIPANSVNKGTIVGDGAQIIDACHNSTAIGSLSKVYIDPTYGIANGFATTTGYQSIAGSWRATNNGADGQALAVSSSNFGYGGYVNISHGMTLGRGGYNIRGGFNIANTAQVGGSAIWLDNQGGTWTNPAISETPSDVTALNAGTYITKIYGRPGIDLKPVPTNTNTRGGHLRIIAGPSTGNAVGGELQLAITPASGSSNNTENAEVVMMTIKSDYTINNSASLNLVAGTTTLAPLIFTSGTNLTTAQAGGMEYDGTNLFFTRSGTTRENVLVAVDNASAPSTSVGVTIVNYYGSSATNFLGTPNRWASVNILGTVYKIPLYT